MALTPKNGDLTAGLAGQRSETIGASPDPLITGDVPAVSSDIYGVNADEVLAENEVVGFDGDGYLVPAVLGTVAAIGVTKYGADATGAADGAVYAEVWRTGVFNPELLVWDATYDTDAKQKAAFEGAPTPTAIYVRKPTTMTVA